MELYYNRDVSCIIVHYSTIADYVTVYYDFTTEEATGQRHSMCYFVVLGMESRPLNMLGKFSMTELHSKSLFFYFSFLKYFSFILKIISFLLFLLFKSSHTHSSLLACKFMVSLFINCHYMHYMFWCGQIHHLLQLSAPCYFFIFIISVCTWRPLISMKFMLRGHGVRQG